MHRLEATRSQHIHPIGAAQLAAIHPQVGADGEFTDGKGADVPHTMDERKRIGVTQQPDVRLGATHDREVIQL